MNPPPNLLCRPAYWLLLTLVGGAAFSAAYGQAPLYYSNQNQYFLHGLAHAGEGFLADDWLAQTADPTPVFSRLVQTFAKAPWLFHVLLAILAGVYLSGLMGVFTCIVGQETAARRWPIFLAAVFVVHGALGRWLSYEWFGLDAPWYFQAGVAGQYVLGAMLQPSVFGVLLVAAVALFVHDRCWSAAFAVAAAATVHPTYLLAGAILTAGFLVARLVDKDVRGALRLGAATLALVLPVAAFVLWRFNATTPDAYRDAQKILVDVRIPHHCRPALWLDPVAGLQIAWMALSLVLTWRTRLFPILATSLTLAAIVTGLQVATGSDAIALVFPWRISSVLMPIATAAAISRLVKRWPLDRTTPVAFAVIAALVAGGIWIMATGRAFRVADDEQPLFDFVRNHRAPGQVYLLPVSIPDLAKTHGSHSSDFKPPAAKRVDPRVVPIDLQRFRLATKAPIFVDFKAIPYKDVDVIEWRARLADAENWQRSFNVGEANEIVPQLRRRGITHVVVPAAFDLPKFELVFPGEVHRVYRVPGS